MSTEAIWETVLSNAGHIQRTRTPTGWLVREIMDVCNDLSENGQGRLETGYEWRVAMVFVPDPDGVWLKDEVTS